MFISFNKGGSDIYAMRADGSHKRRLTRARGRDDSASWSPDGRFIVFTSFRNDNGEIYVMKRDGSHERRLTRTRTDEDADGWQPLRRG